jgi:hypothetical protein
MIPFGGGTLSAGSTFHRLNCAVAVKANITASAHRAARAHDPGAWTPSAPATRAGNPEIKKKARTAMSPIFAEMERSD